MFKYLRKLKLKKLGIHIDSVDQLNKGLDLEVESPCWINGARLSTYDGKVKKIGAYTYFRSDIRVASFESIGRYCSIARGVRIGDAPHTLSWVSTHPFVYEPSYTGAKINHDDESHEFPKTIIGNDVWIGLNAIILGGVTIGDGAVVAAGAVVTKDIEPYSVVGGVPAKHIKYRFDNDTCKKLLELKWWNYNPNELLTNYDLRDSVTMLKQWDTTKLTLLKVSTVKIHKRAKKVETI